MPETIIAFEQEAASYCFQLQKVSAFSAVSVQDWIGICVVVLAIHANNCPKIHPPSQCKNNWRELKEHRIA